MYIIKRIVLTASLFGISINSFAIPYYLDETQELIVPHVVIDNTTHHQVSLINTGNYLFKLKELTTTAKSSEEASQYDSISEVVTIPRVRVTFDGTTAEYKVEMSLVKGSNDLFQLTSSKLIVENLLGSSLTPITTPQNESSSQSRTYVAFSGGGWHSHTSSAAWLMGAVDALNNEKATSGTMDNLFKNVDALSCNSGGCWFATMLIFSDDFKRKIETQSNDEYKTDPDGYLGATEKIFKDDLYKYLGPVLNIYDSEYISLDYLSNWGKFVKNDSTYAPFDMSQKMSGLTLSSPHLSWAKDKPLIISASLGTNTYVTGNSSFNASEFYSLLSGKLLSFAIDEANSYATTYNVYYEAGIGSNWLSSQNFTPVALTSLGSSSHAKSPTFLEGNINLRYGYWQSLRPWTVTTSINSYHNTDNISILDAAASSSAAVGYLANASYSGSESAIGFSVDDTGFNNYYDDGNMNEGKEDAASKRRIRFADGGYVDNTSVAFMLKHLQTNGLNDNFKIVLFMNSSTLSSRMGVNGIQESVARLFSDYQTNGGGTTKFKTGVKTINVPSVTIFNESYDSSGVQLWNYQAGDVNLRYIKYAVSTKDNHYFGIESEHQGELHVFMTETDKSNAMAGNPGEVGSRNYEMSKIFPTYEATLDTVRDAVINQGGWEHLKQALNL